MPQPLMLLSCGSPEQIAELQRGAAPALARVLGLPQGAALGHPSQSFQGAVAALAGGQPAALVPLALDPGAALNGGGHWAEALGAARQCCLLLIDAAQQSSGCAAAGHALLLRWQVPLLGLVQWGETWDHTARLHDGLPWLGQLSAATDSDGPELAAACRYRWQELQATLA